MIRGPASYTLLSMQSRPTGLMNHRYLRRGFVVFFVLFPWIDFVSPKLCDEDLGGLGKTPASVLLQAASVDPQAASPATVSIAAYDAQQHEQHSEPASSEDDDECFCCCAHILPTRLFSVDTYEVSLAVPAPKDQFLPSPPPRGTYHPPRFA